jgi:O-antigen/teichoic acid export membrane protein
MLVSLYTSRVILNTLGVEDYGIYNVVGGIVTMFAFFNSAMSSATQRFLSYEIGKGDFIQLRKTFNATQVIHVGIAVLIFILAETVGLWFVKTYLVIPHERLEAAIWVYHFSVLSFMVSIIQVPYNATIIAHERMNVYAYVSIIEVLLKLLIVFMLMWITFDKLILYGILHFAVVFLIASFYRIYTRRNFVETKFEVVKDEKLYKTLISFSGWNLFENFALIAKGQGVNMLLNIFYGPIVNAALGVSNQLGGAVNSFVSNFQMAVKPQIIKSYSSKDKEYMTSLIIKSTKFSFYLVLIFSIPLTLEIEQILKLWLKIVPPHTTIFAVLVLITSLIISLSGPMKTAVQATGKIMLYQIVIGTLQLLILPISYIFLKYGYSPEITLYITIVIEIITLLFRLHFLKILIEFPIKLFAKEVLFKNFIIIVCSFSIPLLLTYYLEQNVLRLVITIVVSLLWNLVIIYKIGLNSSERTAILIEFNRQLKKHLKLDLKLDDKDSCEY